LKHTDKDKLGIGLRYLGGATLLSFIGPVVLNSAFKNQDHPLFIAVLIPGAIACIAAVYCMFKGILTIVSSMFDGDKKS
jgi:hypothetical protein